MPMDERDREGEDAKYAAPRVKFTVNDFNLVQVLGEGSMSTVFRAVLKKTGEEYALKVVDKFYVQRHKMTDAVVRERLIMDQLQSELVVRLRFTFQDSQKLYMGMDLHAAGDLFEQLLLRQPLSREDARFYAAEIILILEYLRKNRVVFRDLKPENLLITSTGHLVLTDFGCAKRLVDDTDGVSESVGRRTSGSSSESCPENKKRVTLVGTADYLCPEILRSTGCTYSVDLWGLGCVIFQLFHGEPPFR